jgi:hypothetical protein
MLSDLLPWAKKHFNMLRLEVLEGFCSHEYSSFNSGMADNQCSSIFGQVARSGLLPDLNPLDCSISWSARSVLIVKRIWTI